MSKDKVTEALADLIDLVEALPELGYVHKESQEPICYSPDGAISKAKEALAEARRTPAETVGREAMNNRDDLQREIARLVPGLGAESRKKLANFTASKVNKALRIPAPQPVSTGYSREQVIEAIRHFGSMVATTERIEDYLASRPPVPSQPDSTGESEDRKHLLNILYRLGELWPQEWKTDLAEAADHAKAYLERQGVRVECSTLPKPQTEVEFDETVAVIRKALQSALYPRPEGDKMRSDALYRLMMLKPRPPVPSVLGVRSVEEMEALIDKWYWECRDRSHMNSPAKAKHEAMVKLHTHLLTRQPDIGAVVEALETAKRALDRHDLPTRDTEEAETCIDKALAAIKGGVR